MLAAENPAKRTAPTNWTDAQQVEGEEGQAIRHQHDQARKRDGSPRPHKSPKAADRSQRQQADQRREHVIRRKVERVRQTVRCQQTQRDGNHQSRFQSEQGGDQQSSRLQGITIGRKRAVREQPRAKQKDNKDKCDHHQAARIIDHHRAFTAIEIHRHESGGKHDHSRRSEHVLPTLPRVDHAKLLEGFHVGRSDDFARRRNGLPRFISPHHWLYGITRRLTRRNGQLLAVETVRHHEGGHQFRHQRGLLFVQRQADGRGNARLRRFELVLENCATHDLFQDPQRFGLRSLPAGIGNADNVVNRLQLQANIAQRNQVRFFILERQFRVSPHRGDVLHGCSQPLDLLTGDGWVWGCINRLDSALGCFARLLGPYLADVFDVARRLHGVLQHDANVQRLRGGTQGDGHGQNRKGDKADRKDQDDLQELAGGGKRGNGEAW